MKILEIIIGILIIILILYLCGMFNSISLYFKDKKEVTKESGEISRISYTTDIMTLCLQLIQLESSKIMQSYISLDIPYDITKLDEDVEAVSSKVYSALKKNIYNSNNIIITNEYLMSYIVENAKVILLENFTSRQRKINQLNIDNEE